MTAEEVKKMLGLAPHPREGGWFVQTYKAAEALPAEVFADGRYKGARATGTAIYYLLEPGTFSEMHRLASDEVFHFYAGDTVEMLRLREGGEGEVVLIGKDFGAGERPQVLVEKGVWQGSRLLPGKAGGVGWALLGCTVCPGFEFEDYESGERGALSALWPQWAERIEALTRG